MATSNAGRRTRLSIDLEPDLRRRIKIAAAEQDVTIREYVVTVLRRALAEEQDAEAPAEGVGWAQLSVRSFARDWGSDEDRVYDRLS